MAILGNTYILWIDVITPITDNRGNPDYYRPIVCGVSNGFNSSVEAISVRNKEDKGFDRSRPGYYSCGFDMDGHALGLRYSERSEKANFNEMALLCKNRTTFWAKMADVTNSIVRECLVWISSYKETASNEELYSFSLSLVGVGEPIIEQEFNTVVLATDKTGLDLVTDGNNKLINTKA